MRRREFIAGLGGAAAWPVVARAQPKIPVVGLLWPGAPGGVPSQMAGFRKGLAEAGFVEGRNLIIEYRWANFEENRLPELAADLVRRQVDVIVTPGSPAAAGAAKAATATIPIVFSFGQDAVQAGIVSSLNRPGGNITGVTNFYSELGGKRLGLLHELLPLATRLAVLTSSRTSQTITDVQAAAAAIGRQVEIFTASSLTEIETAFETLVQMGIEGLVAGPGGPLFSTRRLQIIALATRYAVPTIYPDRQDAEVGGLMSYGSSIVETYRQQGIYTGRVLKGEKPADLPVMRTTKFEFVINLPAARLLGIKVPPTLLALADEVIE